MKKKIVVTNNLNLMDTQHSFNSKEEISKKTSPIVGGPRYHRSSGVMDFSEKKIAAEINLLKEEV